MADETNKQILSIQALCLTLFIISFGLYFNTLWNGYALDDGMVLRDNKIVKQGISAIPELLSTPHMRGYLIINNDLYRPLSLVMFAIEYELWGLNPIVSHFFNILFFSGCVILLFLFLDHLFERKKTPIAFITAFLFAIHPIHTEVVANIKSRDELMCFFFAFLSLNIFLKYLRSGQLKQLIIGSLSFLLSILSKETAITLLLILPFILFFHKRENRNKNIRIVVAVFLVATFFLTVRFFVLQAYHANSSSDVSFIDNMLSNPPSALSGFATKIFILGKYMLLLFIPYPLICDYSYNSIPFVTLSNHWVLLSITINIALVWIGVSRFLKNKKDPYAFAIMYYLVTISLFSNIPFITGAPMAERFIFFTSVSACLIAALIVANILGLTNSDNVNSLKDFKVLAILIPIAIIFTIITLNRNGDWKDNYTLYATDIKKAPDNSRLNNYMAIQLHDLSDMEPNNPAKQEKLLTEAKYYSQKAITIYPRYLDAIYTLGLTYEKLNRLDSAEICFKQCLALNPNHFNSINGLGAVYSSTKRFSLAIEQFRKIISLDHTNAMAYSNLGGSYFNLKDYPSAIYNFRQVLLLDPQNKDIMPYMAKTWQLLGNTDSARKYEAMAQANIPGFKL